MRESGYFPAGAEFDPSAPYNQSEVPEKDFDVVCSQTLSRSATVTTNSYIPGASGVDYEPDDEGGCCACGWHDPDDTSDTPWKQEYELNGYTTPLQLIGVLKDYLEYDLQNVDKIAVAKNQNKEFLKRKFQFLIQECECWTDDETEIFEDK